jgi:prepilin-type N-terminal cleavage/methylation domain-containing protein
VPGIGRHAAAARGRSGFTLIELTVVLAVIVTLAMVITPPIGSIVSEARLATASSNCQTIASAIVLFYRDNGFFPSWTLAQAGGPGLPANRLQLLISPGRIPQEDQLTPWTTGVAGQLVDQLVADAPGYAMRGPTSQTGWNGPYVTSVIGADPWGNRYVVNIELLDSSATPITRSGRIKSAVWVLSAGPNGIIETPFVQSIVTAAPGGDDICFRIQ